MKPTWERFYRGRVSRVAARLGLAGSLVVLVVALGAGPQQDTPKPTGADAIVAPNEGCARLAMLEGPWRVTETHFGHGGSEVVVTGTEENRWALQKHALRRLYSTKSGQSFYQAMGLLTWDDVDKKYRGVWIDNTTTAGPATVTGEWNEKTKTMTYTVESKDAGGTKARYTVVERYLDGDHREATTYTVDGDDVVKRMVVRYVRTVPCPSGKIVPLGG